LLSYLSERLVILLRETAALQLSAIRNSPLQR
jgi:hypothetical protein